MKTEEKTQVSEVGFEPGTFRSCVEHSIHYATETPPIPDVLLVLVAPKYINRNGTTTLQSRFDLNKIVLLSGPRCDITQRSVPHVETINNADITKLLRSDWSSDTRALLFYYYLFFIIIIILFYLTVVRGRRSSEGRMKTEEKTKVSEVGFEPGTFRSCVEHSIHYATETPPIPDVLLVLVAPKYINRNVTTTLQSRFTPTAPPHGPPRTLRRSSDSTDFSTVFFKIPIF